MSSPTLFSVIFTLATLFLTPTLARVASNPVGIASKAVRIATHPVAPRASSNSNSQGIRTSDPCGPPSNPTDDSNSVSTCNSVNAPARLSSGYNYTNASTLRTSSPSIYGVTCLQDHTGETLNYNSCLSNYDSLCLTINQPTPPRGQWIWSSGGANCTFGAWLPADNETSAPIPSYSRCRNGILAPMALWCGLENNGWSNVAAVNLKELPVEGGTTGRAVDERYLSWLMVSETYDDTGALT